MEKRTVKINGNEIDIFKKRAPRDYVLYTLVIIIGIILDQLTKYLSVAYLKAVETVPLLKGVLHLTYVENRGAAFGMLKDHRWIFIVVSTVAIIGMAIYLYLGHATTTLYGVSLAMVISGGIGNMIDRLALGYVIDFIDFRLINFAVFNGADSFVCVGAGLLVLALVFDIFKEIDAEREKRENNGSADES